MKRWLLGPDGWTMPVCEIATNPGDHYRFEWEKADGTQGFGFERDEHDAKEHDLSLVQQRRA